MEVDEMSGMRTEDIKWFHSFELADGTKINGIKPYDVQLQEADAFFSEPLDGKSVLDIGSWDGFFSFEAERRGAARVVATDNFCWSGEGWGSKDGFDLIHTKLQSKVEAFDVDVNDLPASGLGQFDVVLFLGVFYHLKDPYAGLENAAKMCADHLVVETVTALPREKLPAMRLFAPAELGGDPTNFWAPNIPALELMLRTFGFSRIEALASPASPAHPLARKSMLTRSSQETVYRSIIHAWR
ncbi:tRNA (mo5U34)-methyltransferase [Sphingobium xanthum]|uniref:class I SAM-dependent methyltransferase n=1 Tax=Sphingobium xanthum TaxID=1387165 RepID=UPI001FEBD76D|nr:methyltransferase domain-containing protein [Sphingobium xanthum]